ncbi:unnamed protein product [Colias eurytheme]|nr:unnamed protein product [Colias eurytheme]
MPDRNHLYCSRRVLLSDPDAELSSWPLELVALREKIHGDKSQQEKELSSLRDEAPGGDADKWRQKRNYTFDQNRQLEEVTKERDGLKRVAAALQRAVSQLVAYCASAEDELNRTVLATLLPKLLRADESLDLDSRPGSPVDGNTSAVSRHVHFAPDLEPILASLDESGALGFLQHQRDLSADIKQELEHSLRRLRHEAQDLLELAATLAVNKQENEVKMLESSTVQITELVDELDSKHGRCDNCEMQKKNMEEAMSECLQRENLLRADLETAMMRLAHLMASDRPHSDVIEGYGTGGERTSRVSRWSLSDASPRAHRDVDALVRERDDLMQQLEAANRQLQSTRKFVEEQATEREAERDEFAARLAALRDENTRLTARLHSNARILAEVEQLENQTREMNQIITDLEAKKAASDEEVKATEEKIVLLRDIIANLESQLEQKTNREAEVLEQLEEMKRTIDERDSKMRAVLGELESLRSERNDTSEFTCAKCTQEEDKYTEYVEMIKEQARWLEERVLVRTQRLERAHEVCSAHASEPSEDLSIREQKVVSPTRTPRIERCEALSRLWSGVDALTRAEDALLKRLADLELQRAALAASAQEVRAERDVLQARMSEQALRVSSLAARLQRQRNDAHALAHSTASDLGVRLHDATAEVQRLKEELESKDRHLARLKQIAEEKEKLSDQHATLYGNTCNPKDKVVILERELSAAQARVGQLEAAAVELDSANRRLHHLLLDKEEQLNQIMALKLEGEDNQKSEIIEAKTSGRTLSDIVSISEYDEQDLQMRRAELKTHNSSLTGAPYDTRDKTLNKTLPPDVPLPNMSSLNIDNAETDAYSPRAESLPANFTPAQNSHKFKRNVNEITIFGTIDKFGESVKHSTAQNIQDNCSMYPNQNVSDSNNISVEPKKIDFSLEPSEIKTHLDFTSLQELGITLDMKQENFPDILSQLKHEIKKSRTELENCKEELKNAEEQLCEFPALKEEVEELKGLLENTMATMEKDKKFYESQLENFSSNKKLLEQKLAELTQEVNEKTKDLNLLKEDILRRETMILELAKEKRNLTGKITELESRINELHNRNASLEKYELDNKQLRDKVTELEKLEQLVSEKNQQIDSLNQHLDRLDDLQRRLNDKTEEADNLKEALEEKSNELFQMQDSVVALNRDITKVVEENDQLSSNNKDLKLRLSKIEKEQENASLKLQNSESERERLNSLNSDLTAKIEELKVLTDQLKDKEAEIEILHEDINSYHSEIASLKEQLKMVSRSPSPRNKSLEERRPDRQAGDDRKQLVKIKKQISLLQHELDFNKKELNDKAFELAKAKLDVTELKSSLSQAATRSADVEQSVSELRGSNQLLQRELDLLQRDKQQLAEQLEVLVSRLREEGNISELKQKLKDKAERCRELEVELSNMRELVERLRGTGMAVSPRSRSVRSPTAELERALRVQLQHSRNLDEDIMEQILSASSDDQEEIPRLALDSSKTSSVHSTSSDRYERARAHADKLQLQLEHLEARLRDKDALIGELNRIRDKLTEECEALKLREEAESDNSARLQLLLDAQQHTATALQKQDTSMISILKRRLESAMQSELELREREQHLLARLALLEARSPKDKGQDDRLAVEMETTSRLKGEILVLKSKLDMERERNSSLQRDAERVAARAQREEHAREHLAATLKAELAELRRLKHEAGVELVRARELLSIQSDTIRQLEGRLAQAMELDTSGVASPYPQRRAPHVDDKEQATCEIDEVRKIINGISTNAAGHDTLTIEMIRMTLSVTLPIITSMINMSISEGIFPDCWKVAKITPLPKKDNVNDFKDLRAISILPVISKIIERIVCNQLTKFIEKENVLPLVQSGFRKGHGTATALAQVTDDIISNSDEGNGSLLVLLDFTRAFDCIDVEMMVAKLKFYGVSSKACKWFRSYLMYRKQYVVVQNGNCTERSTDRTLSRGCPQGSILSPLLFSIYTADLVKKIKHGKVHLYADDTQIYYPINTIDPKCLELQVNNDLEIVNLWAKRNALLLNLSKTKFMILGTKTQCQKIKKQNLKIGLGNIQIARVDSARNLGVLLDEELRYEEHINLLVRNAFYKLKAFYQFREHLTENIRVTLTEALVLSAFNYCDTVYGPRLYGKTERAIQRVQNACARFCFGIPKREHITPYLNKKCILKMKGRRELHLAGLVFKVIKTGKPVYLYEKLSWAKDSHALNTRSKADNKLIIPKHKTKGFRGGFKYSATKIWNDLPPPLRLDMAYITFKKKLKIFLFQKQVNVNR